jgi:anti-anti-sigma regulatory factor
MGISIRKDKNIPVVSVKGRIDAITAPEFEKKGLKGPVEEVFKISIFSIFDSEADALSDI